MLNKVLKETYLMLVVISLLPLSAAQAADATKSAATPTAPLTGNVVKKTTVKAPPHHIDFDSAAGKHSSNTFTDISQSMPAAAVKENLRRKHELPSAQTAVLRPGAPAGSATLPAPGAGAANAPATMGAAPETLSPGKVAIPESKGSPNPFFK